MKISTKEFDVSYFHMALIESCFLRLRNIGMFAKARVLEKKMILH